jgi:hypothetical protein
MNNIAVTTRVALDFFEYDPYGLKPDWWQKMVVNGKAFEHVEHATFNTPNATYHPKTGDRIFLTEYGELGVWTPEQFKVRCRLLDKTKDAAPMFKERVSAGCFKFMDGLGRKK